MQQNLQHVLASNPGHGMPEIPGPLSQGAFAGAMANDHDEDPEVQQCAGFFRSLGLSGLSLNLDF